MKEKKPAYDEAYLDDYRQLFARGLADRFYVSCEYLLNRWEIKQKDGKPSGMFQDTNYYPAAKKDAQVFYGWLAANEAEAKRLDLEGYRKLWRDLDVRYDYH